MNTSEISVDEFISILNRSSLTPVIVEGKDDMAIYRNLEKYCDVDVLSVGGRNKVLELFKRRHELSIEKIIFIADQDTWVNTGIPNEYISNELIFTQGYSIENDIFLDYKCEEILKNKEKYDAYLLDLVKYRTWYALAIENIDSGDHELHIAKHPREILNSFSTFESLRCDDSYPYQLKQAITDNHPYSIRGKSLIELFLMHANGHSKNSILDSIAARPGANIENLFRKVQNELQNFTS